jgi:hypothetical protein
MTREGGNPARVAWLGSEKAAAGAASRKAGGVVDMIGTFGITAMSVGRIVMMRRMHV